jgi:AraC family transcriptional regulator
LAVALDAGYGSHEAFTRAFRDRFGQTPEEVRANGAVSQPECMEPLKMDETFVENLAPSRFVDGGPLLIAGFSQRYTSETSLAIPSLWQRFGPHFGSVPGQKNDVGYGVCCNFDDDSFEYIAGVEVKDFADLTSEYSRLRIPRSAMRCLPPPTTSR